MTMASDTDKTSNPVSSLSMRNKFMRNGPPCSLVVCIATGKCWGSGVKAGCRHFLWVLCLRALCVELILLLTVGVALISTLTTNKRAECQVQAKSMCCHRLHDGQLDVFFTWLRPSSLFSSLLLWNSAASCVRERRYHPPAPPYSPNTQPYTLTQIQPPWPHLISCIWDVVQATSAPLNGECQRPITRSQTQWGHSLFAESSPHLQ